MMVRKRYGRELIVYVPALAALAVVIWAGAHLWPMLIWVGCVITTVGVDLAARGAQRRRNHYIRIARRLVRQDEETPNFPPYLRARRRRQFFDNVVRTDIVKTRVRGFKKL